MNKVWIVVCSICIVMLGACGFYIYELREQTSQLRIQTALLKQNIDKVEAVQLSNRKDLETYAKTIDLDIKSIQKDIKGMGGQLVAVGSSIAKLAGKIQTNQPSTGSNVHTPPIQPAKCELCDIHSYTANLQLYDLYFGDLRYGYVSFDAGKKEPWGIQTFPLTHRYSFALAQKSDESFVLYSKMAIERTDGQGKPIEFSTESQFFQVKKPEKKWHWWTPHLDLSFDNILIAGKNPYSFGASLGWSAIAYGRTLNDNSWRLLRLGVGIDNKESPNVSIHPLSYNMGDLLPLISDAWLSFGLMYNSKLGFIFSLGTTL